jgi:hypothetical protein
MYRWRKRAREETSIGWSCYKREKDRVRVCVRERGA